MVPKLAKLLVPGWGEVMGDEREQRMPRWEMGWEERKADEKVRSWGKLKVRVREFELQFVSDWSREIMSGTKLVHLFRK